VSNAAIMAAEKVVGQVGQKQVWWGNFYSNLRHEFFHLISIDFLNREKF
jgi:hypothetical protein